MKRVTLLLLFIGLFAMALAATAQDKKMDMASGSSLRADLNKDLDEVEKKLTDLCNAMPDATLSWRPKSDVDVVRSVSEVFAHVAGSNYFLLGLAGIKSPDGLAKDFEKTYTKKAELVEQLHKSFAFMHDALKNTSDADMNKPAKWFGSETTVGGIFTNTSLHQHEHLGQAIAYARVNGVVPPWTAEELKAAKDKKKD
ncbi:MAG TPA: DinB family protein [Bacteroidota bacterium]|nr:DinB family protein [Bacteroidota bacterium]